MYFGLIKKTSSWYHGEAALCQFSAYSFVTLTTWLFFLFLHYRPLLLGELRGTGIGKFVIISLGMVSGFSWLGLTIGMAWYFWRLDTSRIWLKLIWIVLALLLSPYAEVAYFALVYRENVLRSKQERVAQT